MKVLYVSSTHSGMHESSIYYDNAGFVSRVGMSRLHILEKTIEFGNGVIFSKQY